jgi:hypothetical protein
LVQNIILFFDKIVAGRGVVRNFLMERARPRAQQRLKQGALSVKIQRVGANGAAAPEDGRAPLKHIPFSPNAPNRQMRPDAPSVPERVN